MACELNQNCPAGCEKCTTGNETPLCQCKSGKAWEFESKTCVKNPLDVNCLVISNYTGTMQCFQCVSGFTLTSNGTGCVSNCGVENCSKCVHSTSSNYPDYCQTCLIGFTTTPNLTKCVPCQSANCAVCSYNKLQICLGCKIGFNLQGDGSCK